MPFIQQAGDIEVEGDEFTKSTLYQLQTNYI